MLLHFSLEPFLIDTDWLVKMAETDLVPFKKKRETKETRKTWLKLLSFSFAYLFVSKFFHVLLL